MMITNKHTGMGAFVDAALLGAGTSDRAFGLPRGRRS